MHNLNLDNCPPENINNTTNHNDNSNQFLPEFEQYSGTTPTDMARECQQQQAPTRVDATNNEHNIEQPMPALATRTLSSASLASYESSSSSTSGFSTNNEYTIPADYKQACQRAIVTGAGSDDIVGQQHPIDDQANITSDDTLKNTTMCSKAKPLAKEFITGKTLIEKLKAKRMERNIQKNAFPKTEILVSIEDSDSKDDDEDEEKKEGNTKALDTPPTFARRFKGIGFTLMSAFFFSLTTVIVKKVKGVSSAELALFRFVGILLMTVPVAWEQNTNFFGTRKNRPFLVLRGLAGATSLFCRYSALNYMGLADTTIIILSMPVFVFIFARIFLKEAFGRFHVISLCLSIVGIVFASKLNVLFGGDGDSGHEATTPLFDSNATMATTIGSMTTIFDQTTTTTNETTTMSPELGKSTKQLYGTIFSLCSMVIGSFVYVITRKVRGTHYSVILFNFSLVAITEMSIINAIFYRFTLPTLDYSPWWIVLLCVFSFYGQFFLTNALICEEAGVVSVIRVSGEALFAFVFQISIFHDMPDVFTIAGAVLVLSSVFLLSFRKYIIGLPDDSPTKQSFKFMTL